MGVAEEWVGRGMATGPAKGTAGEARGRGAVVKKATAVVVMGLEVAVTAATEPAAVAEAMAALLEVMVIPGVALPEAVTAAPLQEAVETGCQEMDC